MLIIIVSLVILVDIGSTHNFIDASLIPDLQMPVDISQILEVKVANGEIIKTQGLCKDVLVFIHGQIFFVHLHVLPLGGCDFVLETLCVTPQTQKDSKHERRTIKSENIGDFSFLFFSLTHDKNK